jgi:hypothetical protein
MGVKGERADWIGGARARGVPTQPDGCSPTTGTWPTRRLGSASASNGTTTTAPAEGARGERSPGSSSDRRFPGAILLLVRT